MIVPHGYLVKVDLARAYRVVTVHESNYTALGLKYVFSGDTHATRFYDTRLPFGLRRSPQIFTELTQAVRAIMAAKGHDNIIAYLDDFLCVSPSYEEAKQTLQVLLQLLRDLGFWINYSKIEGPTQHLTFLGIDLDTNTMTMALPPQKITDLKSCLNKIKSCHKSYKTCSTKPRGQTKLCHPVHLWRQIPSSSHPRSHQYPRQTMAPLTRHEINDSGYKLVVRSYVPNEW